MHVQKIASPGQHATPKICNVRHWWVSTLWCVNAAGDEGYKFWETEIARVSKQYGSVIMLGDSMGASAALLFSHLATTVQAFTPQVGSRRFESGLSILLLPPNWQSVLACVCGPFQFAICMPSGGALMKHDWWTQMSFDSCMSPQWNLAKHMFSVMWGECRGMCR